MPICHCKPSEIVAAFEHLGSKQAYLRSLEGIVGGEGDINLEVASRVVRSRTADAASPYEHVALFLGSSSDAELAQVIA